VVVTGTVEVQLFAAARAAAGCSEWVTEPGSLGEVLTRLASEFPALGEVLPRCSFLVDEVSVKASEPDTALLAGSRLDVLPPFAGG